MESQESKDFRIGDLVFAIEYRKKEWRLIIGSYSDDCHCCIVGVTTVVDSHAGLLSDYLVETGQLRCLGRSDASWIEPAYIFKTRKEALDAIEKLNAANVNDIKAPLDSKRVRSCLLMS